MAVSTERRRAHVVLPTALLNEIDARVGPRQRSEFIQEAIENELRRLRRIESFEQAVATPTEGIPDWEYTESTAEWLRALRQESESARQSP